VDHADIAKANNRFNPPLADQTPHNSAKVVQLSITSCFLNSWWWMIEPLLWLRDFCIAVEDTRVHTATMHSSMQSD
jgi:hypothetical protein